MAQITITQGFWNDHTNGDFYTNFETFKIVIAMYFVDKEVDPTTNSVIVITPPLSIQNRHNLHKYERPRLFLFHTQRSYTSNIQLDYPMKITIHNFNDFLKKHILPPVPQPQTNEPNNQQQTNEHVIQPQVNQNIDRSNFEARINDILQKLMVIILDVNSLAGDMRNNRTN
jgi:hypothetical protein